MQYPIFKPSRGNLCLVQLCTVLTILAGCDQSRNSDEVQQQHDLTSRNSIELLESLTTGNDSRDPHSFWSCQLDGNSQNSFDLRLWANQKAAIGAQAAYWVVNSVSSITLAFESTKTTLNSIVVGSDQFTGVSESNETLACTWSGQQREQEFVPLLDNSSGSEPGLTSHEQWLCTSTTAEGNALGIVYTFHPDGSGTFNNLASNWFLDNRNNLVISTESQIDSYTLVEFNSNVEPARFSATSNGASIECEGQ